MPIYANDEDLEKMQMSLQINGSVSFLSQTPWLIKGTVQDNIVMDQIFDQRRLDEAIKYSALDIDLKVWTDGLQHKIGQDGGQVSGGQKARIAFARCLYRNSDIYILDDIVSALDSGVASFVMKETIGKYLKGRTVILSTHNLSTLPYSDYIIYMEHGKIVQEGDFASMSQNVLWKKHTELFEENSNLLSQAHSNEELGLKKMASDVVLGESLGL